MAKHRQANNRLEFSFGYKELMDLTGLSQNLVQQHVSRGKLDPSKLESVVMYLATHARPDLRLALLDATLRRETAEERPGKLRNRAKGASK